MRTIGLFLVAGLVGMIGTPRLQAGGPVGIQVFWQGSQLTREVCAQKAVEAMGVKEKFDFAEVMEDGNARGWNDHAAVVVLTFAHKDGIVMFIAAACQDPAEAERLRKAVYDHLMTGAHDPNVPKVIKTEGAKKKGAAIHYKLEQHGAINLLRFFDPVASIVLEKQGYQIQNPTRGLVFGGMPQGSAAAFLAPGVNAVNAHFGVLAAAETDEECEKVPSTLMAAILKILYD